MGAQALRRVRKAVSFAAERIAQAGATVANMGAQALRLDRGEELLYD